MTAPEKLAGVRYLVDDVEAAVSSYTTHLGFTVHTDVAPAVADVIRGPLRLLLSGPISSCARANPADATAAGRNHPPGRPRPRSPILPDPTAVHAGSAGRRTLPLVAVDGPLTDEFGCRWHRVL